MPTIEQLFMNMEAERLGFDSRNHSDTYSAQGSGNTSRKMHKPFTGKSIGKIGWDEELQDLKIIPNKPNQ